MSTLLRFTRRCVRPGQLAAGVYGLFMSVGMTVGMTVVMAGVMAGSAQAQSAPAPAQILSSAATTAPAPAAAAKPLEKADWQACYAIKDKPEQQLACYQRWAESQLRPGQPVPELVLAAGAGSGPVGMANVPVLLLPSVNNETPDGKPAGCRDSKYSELSRFWELQRGSDCDTFGLRGYRPISVSLVSSSSVNQQPTSAGSNNSALSSVPYRNTETKIQLSVRTKVAKGMLTDGGGDEAGLDSLWLAYTQQSYWQLFTRSISRPFRNTDHEPEAIYIYPHRIALPGGWDYRLSGAGIVHQSNGQTEPLSRSWNRVYVMGAAEKSLGPDSSLSVQARVWNRMRESSGNDDNPDIEDYIGRGEIQARWQINRRQTLGMTFRHSLRSQAHGSTRLDWMMAPPGSNTYAGLRYHVQLFTGYGDSLVDFNRRRTALSVGLSLVDW
ncbi:MAG: phospholipase A [Pseudomonadota bacterium]